MTTDVLAAEEATFHDVCERVGEQSLEWLLAELTELEVGERRAAARRSALLSAIDDMKGYAGDGHASMHGLLRSKLGWSEGECRQRMQLARLIDAHPGVGAVLWEGRASVANIAAISRAHANPRCGNRIGDVLGVMLTEAGRMEYADFRRIPERWELLADADGAHKDRQLSHENRNAHVVTWQGATTCAAQWGDLDGPANQEIFDRFVDAEFRSDWDQTVARYGDKASKSLMPRTDAQRRADALTAIFTKAASTTPGSKAPEPVVNILIDHHSWSELMTLAGLFPEHHTDPFESRGQLVSELRCETDHGELVDPYAVLQASLEGHVRFVILNDTGVPIRWGRKRRLFRGASRDAVRTLGYRCFQPGCRTRSRRCEIDHTVEWHSGGETDPSNGGIGCGRHNRLKHRRGYTVQRDRHGHWHTYRPDGTEII
jgi:hypothetical protein